MKRFASLALVLLACCGEAALTTPDASLLELQQVFASQANFDAVRTGSGSATGTGFSGTYAATFTQNRFSAECTVDFVRWGDWFVNTGAPDTTLARILNEGHEDSEGTIEFAHSGGSISVTGVGLENASTLRGPVNQDGQFVAVAGEYQSEREHWGAAMKGTIEGGTMSAELLYPLTMLDDPDMPGSCDFMANAAGAN